MAIDAQITPVYFNLLRYWKLKIILDIHITITPKVKAINTDKNIPEMIVLVLFQFKYPVIPFEVSLMLNK